MTLNIRPDRINLRIRKMSTRSKAIIRGLLHISGKLGIQKGFQQVAPNIIPLSEWDFVLLTKLLQSINLRSADKQELAFSR